LQFTEDEALPVEAIFQLSQFFGLGGFQKVLKLIAIDGKLAIEVSQVDFFVTGSFHQRSLYAVFEGLFVGLADHDSFSSWELKG